MYWPLLNFKWKTHGKFLHDAIKSNRDIRIEPGTLIHKQLRHFIEANAKYSEKLAGKSARQEMHESAIEYYKKMLAGSVSEEDRRYAENHIASHQQYLEEATREFERELESEKNALPT